MKRVLIVFFFVLLGNVAFAQNSNSEQQDLIYTSVEVKPEFPGGIEGFYNYISPKFKKPDVKNLKGRLVAQFVVEKDGSLSNLKVINDIGNGVEDELKRILENCPKWKPGVQNNTVVRVLYTVPFAIK